MKAAVMRLCCYNEKPNDENRTSDQVLLNHLMEQFMTFFEDVIVEGGPSHYAETFDHTSFLKMPFNATVNFGYVLAGLFWLYKLSVIKYLRVGYFTSFAILV